MKTYQNRLPSIIADVQSEFDHVMNEVFGKKSKASKPLKPQSNIVENEHGFEISLDLPGTSLDDIQVEVNEGRLVVSGKRSFTDVKEGEINHRIERWSGEFERSFVFPMDVDFDQVTAELKSGVLLLQVPKSEKAKPRQIKIKSGE